MKISDGFKSLIDQINRDLDKIGFIDKFRYTRKHLAALNRSSPRGILFKYSDSHDGWAINDGGGTEVQYHIYLNDKINDLRSRISHRLQIMQSTGPFCHIFGKSFTCRNNTRLTIFIGKDHILIKSGFSM